MTLSQAVGTILLLLVIGYSGEFIMRILKQNEIGTLIKWSTWISLLSVAWTQVIRLQQIAHGIAVRIDRLTDALVNLKFWVALLALLLVAVDPTLAAAAREEEQIATIGGLAYKALMSGPGLAVMTIFLLGVVSWGGGYILRYMRKGEIAELLQLGAVFACFIIFIGIVAVAIGKYFHLIGFK